MEIDLPQSPSAPSATRKHDLCRKHRQACALQAIRLLQHPIDENAIPLRGVVDKNMCQCDNDLAIMYDLATDNTHLKFLFTAVEPFRKVRMPCFFEYRQSPAAHAGNCPAARQGFRALLF